MLVSEKGKYEIAQQLNSDQNHLNAHHIVIAISELELNAALDLEQHSYKPIIFLRFKSFKARVWI